MQLTKTFPGSCFPRRGAFTLLELLVVVSIVAVLLAVGVMAVQRAREAGHSPMIAYYRGEKEKGAGTSALAIGPTSGEDERDSRFQVRPAPDRCHPCLPATGHVVLNAAMADGSVRPLSAGMSRFVWWAYAQQSPGHGWSPRPQSAMSHLK